MSKKEETATVEPEKVEAPEPVDDVPERLPTLDDVAREENPLGYIQAQVRFWGSELMDQSQRQSVAIEKTGAQVDFMFRFLCIFVLICMLVTFSRYAIPYYAAFRGEDTVLTGGKEPEKE